MTSQTAADRKRRFRPLVLILVPTVLAIAGIALVPNLPVALRVVYSLVVALAALLLTLGWAWWNLPAAYRRWLPLGILLLASMAGWLIFNPPTTTTSQEPEEPPPPRAWSCDVEARKLARIPGGTLIGTTVPEGWSDIVMRLRPRYRPDGPTKVPAVVVDIVNSFSICVLLEARAGPAAPAERVIERAAIGISVTEDGKDRIVASGEGRAPLGWLKTKALERMESALDSSFVRARTPSLWIFDVPTDLHHEGRPAAIVRRYAVWLEPPSGKAVTVFWEIDGDAGDGYVPDRDAAYALPAALDDEIPLALNASTAEITRMFSPARRPQGVRFLLPASLRGELEATPLTKDTVQQLERELHRRAAGAR